MSVLMAGNGNSLNIGAKTAGAASAAPVGSTLAYGNGGRYAATPYEAYSGMFGVSLPNNDQFVYTCALGTNPTTFPNGTTWEWLSRPDPRNVGIEGFLALSYGNYDSNSIQLPISAAQVKNITAMSLNVAWTYTGSNLSGLLSECYLTTTKHQTGSVSGGDPVVEVGFFPRCSPASKSFAASSTQIGSFTDINSVVWNVAQATSSISIPIPYLVATRVGYVDHQGVLDFKSYFTFLVSKGLITGNEYFNGAAFGVEVFGLGAGQLTLNTFTATYS